MFSIFLRIILLKISLENYSNFEKIETDFPYLYNENVYTKTKTNFIFKNILARVNETFFLIWVD